MSLLFITSCAKEDSKVLDIPSSNIVNQYTLTTNSGNGGSVTVLSGHSFGDGTFEQGKKLTLRATPDEGYAFTGWSNGSKSNPLIIYLNSNLSITANFEFIVLN
jgi:hypothetical protein